MRKTGIVIAAAFLMPAVSLGQTCFQSADGAPILISGGEAIALESAFEDYVFMLDDACAAWGFTTKGDCGIVALMGDVGLNAFATHCDGVPVIVYNRELTAIVGGDGAEFVIAHELGHHICNHFERTPESREAFRVQELEADRFAGATMRKMGRTLEITSQITDSMADKSEGNHPARDLRAKAIIDGWEQPAKALACRTSVSQP